MFRKLLDGLIGTQPPTPIMGADVALAALLVQIAQADDEFAKAEAEEILAILQERLGVSAQAAEALIQEGIKAAAGARDTVGLTRIIKDVVPYEERGTLIEDLWRLVLADDHRDHEEDGAMRLITNLLGVSDKDSALARHAAARAKGG